MSIFIGKDNSNTSALIITKNQLSVESIKSSTPNKLTKKQAFMNFYNDWKNVKKGNKRSY